MTDRSQTSVIFMEVKNDVTRCRARSLTNSKQQNTHIFTTQKKSSVKSCGRGHSKQERIDQVCSIFRLAALRFIFLPTTIAIKLNENFIPKHHTTYCHCRYAVDRVPTILILDPSTVYADQLIASISQSVNNQSVSVLHYSTLQKYNTNIPLLIRYLTSHIP